MRSKAAINIIDNGIDGIDELLIYGEPVGTDELLHRLYNEDYFIIGTNRAKQFLEDYGVFDAIEKIKNYEKDNFGEVNTDLSDPEKVVNMLAYIEGEEALNACPTYRKLWGKDEYTVDDLKAIQNELEELVK